LNAGSPSTASTFRTFHASVPAPRLTAGVLRTHLTLSGTTKQPRAVGDASLNGGAGLIEAVGGQVHDANASL
jgi:hypothetical protein